jgi:hypothetical protein
MSQVAQLHTSVYISNGNNLHGPIDWCNAVVNGHHTRPRWLWSRRDVNFDSHHASCYVFIFVDPKRKLLFDIAWSHLGIHNSVQSLEHQLDRELV